MTNKRRITAQEFLVLQANAASQKAAEQKAQTEEPQAPKEPEVIRRDSDLWAV